MSIRSRLWWLFALAAVGVAAIYVSLPHSHAAELLYIGVAAAGVVATFAGIHRHRPPCPEAWRLLGAGLACFLGGELLWLALSVLGHEPFPSVADGVYLAGYLLIAAGLALLVRHASPVRDTFGTLDATIVVAACALLSWLFLMAPLAGDGELSFLGRVFALAYPACDLLLVAFAARLMFGLRARTPALALLGVALSVQLGSDAIYGVAELGGVYAPGGWLDGGWLVAYALFGAAALHPSVAAPAVREDATLRIGPGRLSVLTAATVVPPAALLLDAFGVVDLTPANVAVAALAGVVVFTATLVRMAGLVRTVDRLARHENERRFMAMVENSSDIIAVLTGTGRVAYVSPAVLSMWGYERDHWIDAPLADFVAENERDAFAAHIDRLAAMDRRATLRFEGTVLRVDGTPRYFEAVGANLLEEPNVGGLVVTMRDATDWRTLETQLTHQAFHDPLTGLANRALFLDRIEHAIARRRRSPEEQLAVLLVDLDDFKSVNDGLGHAVGDELLQVVGSRLTECLRAGDTAARLGGDEFAVLLENDANLAHAKAVAARILDVLRLPLHVGDVELTMLASVGIAMAAVDATTTSLLQDADIAMYEAKRNGKGRYEVFDASMRRSAEERIELKTDLTRAMGNGELHLVYQPIVDMVTGEIAGAEALLRWHHPVRGVVPPLDFIPLAEQSGLIVQIGRWVLTEACDEAARWQADGQRRSVAVNASAVQFRDPRFVEDVEAALTRSGLPADLLTVEITETAVMEDTEVTIAVLSRLKALGVRVAIDDFGTGYCSLSYLQRFPVDTVKIDRVFIAALSEEATGTSLAESILAIADSLSLRSVAEGIEDIEQLGRLGELGCHLGQGFHFSRPVEPARLRAMLAAGPVELPGSVAATTTGAA